MAAKRHRPEEIVTKLRQVEVLVGQGIARIDAIREVRITKQTFYRWRKQYGGIDCPHSGAHSEQTFEKGSGFLTPAEAFLTHLRCCT